MSNYIYTSKEKVRIKMSKGILTKREREVCVEPQNGLILDDSFQRAGDVWGTKDKVKLIESILMDIPIPFIYLAEGKKGNLIVIDGRQRLTALFDYLDNKYLVQNNHFLLLFQYILLPVNRHYYL